MIGQREQWEQETYYWSSLGTLRTWRCGVNAARPDVSLKRKAQLDLKVVMLSLWRSRFPWCLGYICEVSIRDQTMRRDTKLRYEKKITQNANTNPKRLCAYIQSENSHVNMRELWLGLMVLWLLRIGIDSTLCFSPSTLPTARRGRFPGSFEGPRRYQN